MANVSSQADTEFKVGTRIGRYSILQKPSHDANDPIARPLGRGGTAAVYLVQQSMSNGVSIPRALKLFSPSKKIEDRRVARGQTPGRQSFLQEISAISSLTHQNLVKIIDAGELAPDQPYFVMEYIEGSALDNLLDSTSADFASWKARAQLEPFHCLRMVQQVCWPTSYLHSRRFFHFDIAPKNIFVREVNGKPHVMLGDLGVGRHVLPLKEITPANSRTKIEIAGTKKYTPVELHPFLEQGWIELGELAKYADYWDVYGIACVAENMIEEWGLQEHPDLEATRILCTRMKSKGENLDAIQTSELLDRLLPAHVLTAGVEELSTDAFGRRKYVNIPLYPAPISERVEQLIDHPVFTRLQLVPQLLLVRSVFPGGTHTTFEHTLGSFALATRCIAKLLSQPRVRVFFNKKEIEEAILTILLAKITSFPLDRIFFSIFVGYADAAAKRRFICSFLDRPHENATLREVIVGQFKNADINSVLDILCEPVATLRPYQKLISGLLRSSLDVRVMDYLARDSHHTGVPAGTGIDVANVIENLTWTRTNGTLGITRFGVFSVEHMLSSRYWMFSRVYWNQQNRAITAMLRHILFEMLERGFLNEEVFLERVVTLDEPGALQLLTNLWKFAAPRDYKDGSILNLLQQSRPRPYKQVLELFTRNWSSVQMDQCRNLTSVELEKLREDYLNQTPLAHKLAPSTVLFDVPVEHPLKLGEDIYVDVGGTEERFTDASEIGKALPKAFADSAVRFRVYCHPDTESGLMREVRNDVRGFLNARFPR